jgi:hypothetical protein
MQATRLRRRAVRAGIVAAVCATSLFAAATANAAFHSWSVAMDGPQQCATKLPCDPDGTGTADITADSATNTVCGRFTWNNVSGPVGFGHIHQARPGQPENVGFTINIFGPPTSTAGFPSGVYKCTTVPGPVIDEMARYGSFFMVTIHNTEYPAGPIRGQLEPPGRTIWCDLGVLCPGP